MKVFGSLFILVFVILKIHIISVLLFTLITCFSFNFITCVLIILTAATSHHLHTQLHPSPPLFLSPSIIFFLSLYLHITLVFSPGCRCVQTLYSSEWHHHHLWSIQHDYLHTFQPHHLYTSRHQHHGHRHQHHGHRHQHHGSLHGSYPRPE